MRESQREKMQREREKMQREREGETERGRDRERGRERERERERDGGRDEQPVHVKTHNTALQVCICARASMQAKLDHLDI